MEKAPALLVRRYVAVLAALAIAGLVIAGLALPMQPADARLLLSFAALAVLSVWVPLRFAHGTGIQGFNLGEAVLVALLLTQPAGLSAFAIAVAAVLGYGVKVRSPIKVAFNVAQTSLWASVGAVVFHALGGGPGLPVLSWENLAAIALGTTALNVVGMAAMAELFRRYEQRPYRSVLEDVVPLHVITWIGNTSAGLLLALVARQEPLASCSRLHCSSASTWATAGTPVLSRNGSATTRCTGCPACSWKPRAGRKHSRSSLQD